MTQVYPKHSVDLYDSYLQTTSKPHEYFVLDLSQNINDLLRFRTEVFPDDSLLHLIYALVDYDTDTLHVLKEADSKLRKPIKPNGNQETLKSICECALNVLRGNIPLSPSSKRKLRTYKNSLRTVVDKNVSVSAKRTFVIQRGGFLLPLPLQFYQLSQEFYSARINYVT